MKIYFFIINPAAGNGKALKKWNKVKVELQQKNVRFRSFFTERPGHAEQIARQIAEIHADHLEAIVAVGGDGTIHEIMNGLTFHEHIKIGYIPAGSGNDFARGFSIPSAPLDALNTIIGRGGKTGQYDVGGVLFSTGKGRHKRFVNSVGAGFDAEVSKTADEAAYKPFLNKLGLGRFAYMIALLKTMAAYKPADVTVTIDGKTAMFEKVWFITISNSPFYGGGMKISPAADPADGILDVCVVYNLPAWKLLLLFGSVFFGWHKHLKEVELFTGRNISVTSESPFPVHTDGEQAGMTPIQVSVQPSRRSIYSKKRTKSGRSIEAAARGGKNG
ncbi:diacylglycerol/lipid kinase family protein [Bacillus marinisedimentorum]|uniref:diacylglycerol/lipid kinase family protein n=1 Tax=Bacillus marinisedimentorum TaxID=1821260 RepID=UPI00087220ED|nr:diacylglycerol kinase family protein [Bacillus marinisedimentorum]